MREEQVFQMKTILDEIRDIVNSHLADSQGDRVRVGWDHLEGHTIGKIAKATNIERANLSRFLMGKAGLSSRSLCSLCTHFNIHVHAWEK